MEINFVTPTKKQQDEYSGDVKLALVMALGTQPIDRQADLFGDCNVFIDETGWLMFEYYFTEPNINYEEPPDEATVMCSVQCSSIETAKRVAQMVLDVIDNINKDKWREFGFTIEAI